MIKRKSFILGFVFIVLVLLVSGCGQGKNGQDNKNAGEVTVITAKAVTLDRAATAGGKLEALESANLVSKISGKVATITVDVGSRVKAGDLLLSLDAEDLAALVRVAEANLQKAKTSDLPSLKNQALSKLTAKEATYNNAEIEYTRAKTLLGDGAVSRQAFDQAEKAYLLAKSEYEEAKKNLEIVNSGTVPDTVRLLEAQLAQARANYANSRITAPISGVITARNINPGELASPSQPVLSIVNLDKVVLRVDVAENLINTIKEGSVVDVKVPAVSTATFKGTITNVALAANPSTKAYQVKIQIANPGHLLKPGMFAEAELKGKAGEAITIPRQALLKTGDNNAVWLVADGTARKREIIIQTLDDKNVLVLSGLNNGEKVIVDGMKSLSENDKVTTRENK